MSLRIFADLAEERIREAQRRGEFDDLPGKGAPLELEDDSLVPADLRMAYKVLKNSGYLPERLALEKEIATMRDLIDHLSDAGERYRQIQKFNLLVSKYNISHARVVAMEKDQLYHEKVLSRVSVAKPKDRGPGR